MTEPEPHHPSIVREVTDRIAGGWTATVEGHYLALRKEDGSTLGICCGSEESAQALLDAATAAP